MKDVKFTLTASEETTYTFFTPVTAGLVVLRAKRNPGFQGIDTY